MVIEDDEDIRETIAEFLEEQGFTVVQARKGNEGLARATESKPDLVLLDVELPDMTGYDVCEKLKAQSDFQNTPVLMLTGLTEEKDEIRGLKAGADDYIPKPFKPARLLARIMTAIKRNTRELDANALTHMPGNRAIEEEIQRRLTSGRPFSVCYFDLNNFKAFNDRYGFVRGDEAIKLTAQVIREKFSFLAKDDQPFIGHVGGDDFIGLMNSWETEPVCRRIIDEFTGSIPSLYDAEDRQKGKIISKDRKGQTTEFPLMGISIAVVTNRNRKFQHPGEIALVAGELKKWVKSKEGSAFGIDRRI